MIKYFTRSENAIEAAGPSFIKDLHANFTDAKKREAAAEKAISEAKNGNSQFVDQLQADLAVCQAYRTELIQDGQPAWGAQSQVADLLNLPNTGGAYRQRILDVLEELQNRKAA